MEIIATTTGSQLISRPDTETEYTLHRVCAARRAMTRGLSEYLLQLRQDAGEGGRRVQFINSFYDRAVWENLKAKFPSALSKIDGRVTYDAKSFNPQIVHQFDEAEEGNQAWVLIQTGEAIASITIEVWATDPEERDLLALMLEEGLNPVEWMSGVRLSLPHYFGATAEYLLLDATYIDSPEEAMQRYCKFNATVEVRCPLLQARKMHLAQIQLIQRLEN